MNEASQQIDAAMNVLMARDQALKGQRLFQAVMCFLKGCMSVEIVKDGDPRALFSGETAPHGYLLCSDKEGRRHALLLSAVTFLGGTGNHPVFKKRIQLKTWYKSAYRDLTAKNVIVHFMGVYHYKGNVVLVDWGPETYLPNKMHNSSAFVYVNDLFQGMKHGVFTRVDLHGHTITTIRGAVLADYLNGQTSLSREDTPLSFFKTFNRSFPFGRWIQAGDAIQEMFAAQWPEWRQGEWPGWFLEYRVAAEIKATGTTAVEYCGNSRKKKGQLDFDLWFPHAEDAFHGDLKASDAKKKAAPGNDQSAFLRAIAQDGRFWYVIFEHDTVKDTDCGLEATHFRTAFLLNHKGDGKWTFRSADSYGKRMKNRVRFVRMMILELNRANCNQILADFNQGRQPARKDGRRAKRATKFLIRKNEIENFLIYHYEPSSGKP